MQRSQTLKQNTKKEEQNRNTSKFFIKEKECDRRERDCENELAIIKISVSAILTKKRMGKHKDQDTLFQVNEQQARSQDS